MNKKHAPPRRCYVRRWVVGSSPSAICARCLLGLRSGCSKCEGCTANVREQRAEGFKEGLEAGVKDPWFRIDEHGNVIILRELTSEEKKGLAMCKAIADRARALYGITDEEDEET